MSPPLGIHFRLPNVLAEINVSQFFPLSSQDSVSSLLSKEQRHGLRQCSATDPQELTLATPRPLGSYGARLVVPMVKYWCYPYALGFRGQCIEEEAQQEDLVLLNVAGMPCVCKQSWTLWSQERMGCKPDWAGGGEDQVADLYSCPPVQPA